MPYSGEPAVEQAAFDGSRFNFIGARITDNTAVAAVAGSWTPYTFSAATSALEYDTGGLWLPGAPTKFTIIVPGYYLVSGLLSTGTATAADRKGAAIVKNASTPAAGVDIQNLLSDAGTTALVACATGVMRLAKNDTIGLCYFSTSANTCNNAIMSIAFLGS